MKFFIPFIVALTFAAPAYAQDTAYSFGNDAEAFVLGGLTGGGSFGSPGGGGFVGGEMSLVWLKEGLWGGLYADGLYDFGHSAATVSVGPEIGYALFGLDGGVAFRFGRDGEEDSPEIGYHARALLGMGGFALFGRYGIWPNSQTAEHVVQIGLLLKMPFWNSTPTPDIAR